jgi:hypothetical protein
LFGLTLSIAMLWTRLVVVPAVIDYRTRKIPKRCRHQLS